MLVRTFALSMLLLAEAALAATVFGVPAMHQLADKMKAENEIMLGKLEQASVEERQKWCAAAPTSFAAPELDPSPNPAMVKTIMGYQLKKR